MNDAPASLNTEKEELENYRYILRRLEKDCPEEIVRMLKVQKNRLYGNPQNHSNKEK